MREYDDNFGLVPVNELLAPYRVHDDLSLYQKVRKTELAIEALQDRCKVLSKIRLDLRSVGSLDAAKRVTLMLQYCHSKIRDHESQMTELLQVSLDDLCT